MGEPKDCSPRGRRRRPCRSQHRPLLLPLRHPIYCPAESLSNLQNDLPVLTDFDKQAIACLCTEFEVDFISLSYCRSVEDVQECREFLAAIGQEQTKVRRARLRRREGGGGRGGSGAQSPATTAAPHAAAAAAVPHTAPRRAPHCRRRSSPSARRGSRCSTSGRWWTRATPSSSRAATSASTSCPRRWPWCRCACVCGARGMPGGCQGGVGVCPRRWPWCRCVVVGGGGGVRASGGGWVGVGAAGQGGWRRGGEAPWHRYHCYHSCSCRNALCCARDPALPSPHRAPAPDRPRPCCCRKP